MTAQDFTKLHLQYLSEQQPGEYPCTIEHDFADGRMVDHYFVTPSAAFLADEAIAQIGGPDQIVGLLFLQGEAGAPWQLVVHEKTMLKNVSFDFPAAELQAMLQASGVILPGEPGFVPPKK